MTLLKVQFYVTEVGRWIENVLLVICGVLLSIIASTTFYEVVIRFVVHAPTAWSQEVAQFMLVWYSFLAAAVGARRGIHFALRWGIVGFNERVRWLIRQGSLVLIIMFLLVLLKAGLDYLNIVGDQTSPGAEINMAIPYGGIPAGIAAILIMYILDLADAVLSTWTGCQFSVREAREQEIYRLLKGETLPSTSLDTPPSES